MKFRYRKGLIFVCLFFMIFMAIFFAFDFSRRGLNKDNSVLLFGVLFFLYLSCLSPVVLADITIDNDGFYRSFLGRRLFSIDWSDLSLITDRMERAPGGEEKRFITLVSHSEFPRKAFAKRFMRLGEGIIGFSDFIRAFNTEIKKHNIPVELSRDGKTVMQNEILLRIPEGQLWNPMRD